MLLFTIFKCRLFTSTKLHEILKIILLGNVTLVLWLVSKTKCGKDATFLTKRNNFLTKVLATFTSGWFFFFEQQKRRTDVLYQKSNTPRFFFHPNLSQLFGTKINSQAAAADVLRMFCGCFAEKSDMVNWPLWPHWPHLSITFIVDLREKNALIPTINCIDKCHLVTINTRNVGQKSKS